MSTEMRKEVKRTNDHLISVELQHLNKLTRFVIEQRDLLSQVEAKDLSDFEAILNNKTGFVKASLSADALGFENEFKRLSELENLLDGKLTDADVDEDGNLTSKKQAEVAERHTIYWTEEELKLNKQLQKVIDVYNALPPQHRNKVVITRSGEMMVSPMLNRY